MKKFWEYIKIIFSRSNSALFWWLDFLGALVLLAHLKEPEVPEWAAWAILAVALFCGSYMAWLNENKKKIALKNKLEAQNKKIPSFVLSVGEVRGYTCVSLIESYKKQLIVKQPPATTSFQSKFTMPAPAGLASAFESISRVSNAFQRYSGVETSQERHDRLVPYVAELKEYENTLRRTYKIDLSITATKADKNIEVTLSSDDTSKMIVQDDYPRDDLPKQPKPPGLYGYAPDIGNNFDIPGKLYLDWEDGDKAYSKLADLNAHRSQRLFGKDFYIQTDAEEVTLVAEVHSEKRDTPQVIKKTISLKDIPVENFEVEASDEED